MNTAIILTLFVMGGTSPDIKMYDFHSMEECKQTGKIYVENNPTELSGWKCTQVKGSKK